MKRKKQIALVYLGDFFFDARLINMTLSLLKENYLVSIIGTHKKVYQTTADRSIRHHPTPYKIRMF